ncbi:MAG TPA: NAD(P)-dependent alcohol dehydrogenase [Anaerolineae bacterium]|jgi:NADPH:quinone reductase-like Zn-dependent oxidoreductase|nr:NAD(P)-dependent alcohol dehydrogenase [Anaerolineae bacterium]
MKAIVFAEYGPPNALQLKEVEKPTPSDNEVLVRVYAAALNAGDWHVLRGELLHRLVGTGLLKPKKKILGDDIAGRVEAVGRNVKQFRPGDEVFGTCNYGAFAEYVCVPKTDWLALKPASISFEEAAALPIAGITALQGIRDKGGIQAGQKVLINGASGGVGTFAVQIAKSFGTEVTGVCSTKKMDLVRSIGADHVIDYTYEDFTRSEKRYDLVFAAGGHHSILDYRRALNPEGTFVCVGGSAAQYFQALFLGSMISIFERKKMGVVLPMPRQEDLRYLMDLVETRKVVPAIDRCYPLSEVPEAMRYLEEGYARGKVVITVLD